MSAAGFLEKLLSGAEVEWVPLGDVTQPTANIKWSEADGVYRYIDLTSVDIKAKRVTETSEISAETAPSRAQKLVEENDVIFATTRPVQQRYCLIDPKLAGNVASTGYCVLRAKQDQALPKWILHWLSTTEFKSYVEENQSGAAYPAISDGRVKAFKIAIPCPDDPQRSLAMQGEIVRILDTFTELTAELAAELAQRKKQYNHYRDHLLTFGEDDAEWKALEEVAHFQNAKPHEKLVSSDGDIALLTAGFISSEGKSARFVKAADVLTPALRGDVAMVMSDLPNGRALAKTFFVEENDRYAANQRVCLLRVRETTIFSPKFLHYVMNRNKQLLRYDSGYDQTHLKKDWILEVKVPVPPIAEQVRIVSILDTFDTLTTSITEGLPREIELREKQYAYYRDQLLNFPKPDPEAA